MKKGLTVVLVLLGFLMSVGGVSAFTVDGSPDDWTGKTPIYIDALGDSSPPSSDIQYCYLEESNGTLYFMYNFSGSPDMSSEYNDYSIWLDIDRDGTTGYNFNGSIQIGMEYVIFVDPMASGLSHWNGADWESVANSSFQGANNSVIEMSVSLADLGNPSQFDLMFGMVNWSRGPVILDNSSKLTFTLTVPTVGGGGEPFCKNCTFIEENWTLTPDQNMTLWMIRANSSGRQIKYDTGSPDGHYSVGYSTDTSGRGHGLRMTPPATPFNITSISIYGKYYCNNTQSFCDTLLQNQEFSLWVLDSNLTYIYGASYRYIDYFTNETFKWAVIPVDNVTVDGEELSAYLQFKFCSRITLLFALR